MSEEDHRSVAKPYKEDGIFCVAYIMLTSQKTHVVIVMLSPKISSTVHYLSNSCASCLCLDSRFIFCDKAKT